MYQDWIKECMYANALFFVMLRILYWERTAPQKYSARRKALLKKWLNNWNHRSHNSMTIVLKEYGIDMAGIKHGGAAGGTVAGLYALLQAKPVNGIDHFLDLTGFDEALEKADLLITGRRRH
jgi:glycerate kinase